MGWVAAVVEGVIASIADVVLEKVLLHVCVVVLDSWV
jgi:hypothetical protein